MTGREEAYRQAKLRSVPISYYLDLPPRQARYTHRRSLAGGIAFSVALAIAILILLF